MTLASKVRRPRRSGKLPKPTELRMETFSSTAMAPATAASRADSPFLSRGKAFSTAWRPNGQVATTTGSGMGILPTPA